jgi:peptide/nickel transport system substrate-binding protein
MLLTHRFRLMPRHRSICLLSLVALAACSRGSDTPSTAATDSPGGTVVIATPTAPDNLMPPITASQLGQQAEDLIFQRLAVIGPGLNSVGDAGFTPDLATRWEWAPDSLSIVFHLDSAARWHDGAPVRAADVAFSFALYKDPKSASATAPLLSNIDSISVRDSLTSVVWYRTRNPSQFFDVVMQFMILPAHLLATADRATLASSPLATQPVGSGPFRIARYEPTQLVELVADTTGGRRRAQLDRVVFSIAPDPVTAFTRVAAGEADVFEAVRPDKVADVAKNAQLRLVMSPALQYMFLGFNFRDAAGKPHPVFSDRAVRRALSMAIDRRSIVANIYDSLAVQSRGPFTVAQTSADTTLSPLPYNVDSANVLLTAAGWVRGADSLRRKNGKVLGFALLTPSTSIPRMRAAVLMQEQFRRVGADVKVDATDGPTYFARSHARKFDAALNTWAQDAGPANARDTWSSAGAAEGGNNLGSYRSPAFDAQLDSALSTFDTVSMRTHFASAWRIITDDAPAIWIAEPRQVMAVNSRIEMRGARADAWWAGIAQWRIPANKRIARDAPTGTRP